MSKKETETLLAYAERVLERADGACSDSPQRNETDDRIVAELAGIRAALGSIALSLAVLGDNSVNPGIRIYQDPAAR